MIRVDPWFFLRQWSTLVCAKMNGEENRMSCCGGGNPLAGQEEQNAAGRKVFCVKFQREMPGLDEPPFDSPLGKRIYDNVSAEAWRLWGDYCKMVLNEY